MNNMPNQSSESNSNIVDTLRELENHLDLAITTTKTTAEQPVTEPMPEGTPEGTAIAETVDQQVETKSPTEQALEQYVQVDEDHPEESPYVIRKAGTQKDDTQTTPIQPSQHQVDIENILAADLSNAYRQMSPEQQEEFKKAGEATATKIVTLIEKAKITARKVLALVSNWLKMIPGVNRFFLEQEVKIKTEEILRYEREYKRKQKN